MFFRILKKLTLVIIGLLILAAIVAAVCWYTFFSAPSAGGLTIDEKRFGTNGAAVVYLTSETSVADLALVLKEKGIIRSPQTFLTVIEKLDLGRKIKQGTYVFTSPVNVITAADRVSKGEYGYTQVKVTIPEGYTTYAIAEALPAKLVDIKKEDFMTAANGLEGYLFPDTYFFYPYATSSAVIGLMQANFNRKIAAVEKEFGISFSTATIASSSAMAMATSTEIAPDSITQNKSQRSLREIITLASILEKEVQTTDDMAKVADLFIRRMEIGMPLQADSTLTYITGKTSAELTMRDLTQTDPYNSYKNLGLPPTPIGNPGLKAIRAAVKPEPNTYLFFLSDDDGITHFSETYAEHLRMKKKYLP